MIRNRTRLFSNTIPAGASITISILSMRTMAFAISAYLPGHLFGYSFTAMPTISTQTNSAEKVSDKSKEKMPFMKSIVLKKHKKSQIRFPVKSYMRL